MAYAALISLQHTIHRLKTPQIIKSADKELGSLHDMLKELDDERRRSMDRSVINELDAKIREAVWKLEDVLDSYQPCQGVDKKGVEQEMDLLMKRVKKLRKQYNRVLKNPLLLEEDDAAVSSIHKSTTVGLVNLSEQVISSLTYLDWPKSSTVSLVGMASIGKTHLATLIHQHPLILRHFHSRAWVRVGPKDQMLNNIYIDIVAQMEGMPRDLFKEKSVGGFLLLEDLDLVHWTAQDSYEKKWTTCKCFPSLRHLIIRHCYIPLHIGETSTVIPTLNTIKVDECSPSVVDSAHQINKKMKYLQLVINSSWNL